MSGLILRYLLKLNLSLPWSLTKLYRRSSCQALVPFHSQTQSDPNFPNPKQRPIAGLDLFELPKTKPDLHSYIPYLVQRQSLSGTGFTRHAARLGGAQEEEDAAAAGDDHPDGPGLRGRGEEASSAHVTVNREQVPALVPGGWEVYTSITIILNSVTETFRN